MQAGKIVDELERLGKLDNTIVLYIWGDNGSSAEGQRGSISELLAQNGIPNTVEQQIAALEKIGGLDALGGPKPTACTTRDGRGPTTRRSITPSWSRRISVARATPW